MLIPKFKIGQKIYAVTHTSDKEKVHQKCDLCNSTGKVRIEGKNEEIICPYCRGMMDVKHHGYRYKIDYYGAKIGKIQTEEYSKKYKDCETRITYMLEETGVDSGLIWKEERLFRTEREAKDFCEKYKPSDEYDSKTILK